MQHAKEAVHTHAELSTDTNDNAIMITAKGNCVASLERGADVCDSNALENCFESVAAGFRVLLQIDAKHSN